MGCAQPGMEGWSMARRLCNLALAVLAVALAGSAIWYVIQQGPPDRPLIPEQSGWGFRSGPITVTALSDVIVRDEQGQETSVAGELSGMANLTALNLPDELVGQLEPAEESVLRTYPLKLVYTDGDGRTYCVAVSRENVGCYGDGFEPRLLEDGGKAWRTMSRVMSDYLN